MLKLKKNFKFFFIQRHFFCLKNRKKILKKETVMLSQASDNLKKVKADRESLNKKQDTLPNENRKAPNFNDGVIPEMVKEEDNYSSIYYTLEIDKSFDLFELRDFFFSFMFSKQRKGHIYMNILDTKFKGVINNLLSQTKKKISLF